MNDDLISRQAAMDEISKQQTYKMFYGEDTMYFDANDVASVLASMPSAERKGKWLDPVVPKDDPFVHLPYCSACGCEIEVDAYCEPLFTEYCPHCGARMERGEQDG